MEAQVTAASVRNGILQAVLILIGVVLLGWLAMLWFTAAVARHNAAMGRANAPEPAPVREVDRTR